MRLRHETPAFAGVTGKTGARGGGWFFMQTGISPYCLAAAAFFSSRLFSAATSDR